MSFFLSITAPSGTGKTSFLCLLIRELVQRNYRVGAIKCCHHPITTEHTGKDSGKLSLAGADPVKAIPSTAAITPYNDQFSETDICLVEGCRFAHIPAVILYRKGFTADKTWRQPTANQMKIDITNPQSAVKILMHFIVQNVGQPQRQL